MFLAVFFSSANTMLLAYAAALVHEMSHFFVCRMLKVRVHHIRVGALGMKLCTGYIPDSKNKILISLAGPLASFLIFIIFGVISVKLKSVAFFYTFAFLNFCIAIINILPVLPLDGGCVLKAVLTQKMGIIRGLRLLKKINLVFRGALVVFCVFLICIGCMSVSFTAIVLFLGASLKKENKLFDFEKSLVLSGKTVAGNKIRYIFADSQTRLLSLASNIGNGFSIVAAIFEQGRFIGEINQKEIIDYMCRHGAMHMAGECFLKNNAR